MKFDELKHISYFMTSGTPFIKALIIMQGFRFTLCSIYFEENIFTFLLMKISKQMKQICSFGTDFGIKVDS